MIKHLDKMVFWMGFTLSLGALYFSSERFNPQRLNQDEVVLDVTPNSKPEISHPKLGETEPLEPIPAHSPEDELWRERMAGFLSAAEDALR